jgi:hypothetical protein
VASVGPRVPRASALERGVGQRSGAPCWRPAACSAAPKPPAGRRSRSAAVPAVALWGGPGAGPGVRSPGGTAQGGPSAASKGQVAGGRRRPSACGWTARATLGREPSPWSATATIAGRQRPRGAPGAALAGREAHLAEPAGGAVSGQRPPPVIPRTAGLPPGAGSAAPHPAPGAGGRGGPGTRGREQAAAEPEDPGRTGAPPFAPGGGGALREPEQHGPRPEPPGRERAQNSGHHRPSQVGRRRETTHTREGCRLASLGRESCGEAWHDRCRPRLPHEGPVCRGGTSGMMRHDQPRPLLQMGMV